MSDINLKIIIALARTYNKVFSKAAKNIESFGLNPSEFGVLEMLHHKGGQPVQKVAEKILVTSGTITYVIDKLVKKGLIRRRQCEKDKRVFYVELTDKGSSIIKEIFPKHKKAIDEMFKHVNGEVKSMLLNSLIVLQEKV
ncbi:MAG: MarR family transcriptional regulator [Fibrobacteres bacterium]|nr:MarR family transcriptional regulator [Fibrobacterota bacterium]